MAKKSWSVTTDEGTFSVDLKGSKVSINGGASERLNRFAKKTHFLDTEYTIPLGNRTATLFVQSMTSPVLAYNGTDCATGQPWEYQKIPAWGWIFIVLDFASILMGVGWLWALLAVIVTGVAIRSKMNTALKVIISAVLTLILVGLGVMGIMLVAATM